MFAAARELAIETNNLNTIKHLRASLARSQCSTARRGRAGRGRATCIAWLDTGGHAQRAPGVYSLCTGHKLYLLKPRLRVRARGCDVLRHIVTLSVTL